MSLGIFRSTLSVSTKQRRSITLPSIEDSFFDFLCTETGEPLLTENARNITLEHAILLLLTAQNNNILLTQDNRAIDTLV